MALSMNTSSIGVSSSGMKRVRDEIQMNLIDESIKSFNGGCEKLINNVDTYWHGASANAFKNKINTDRAKLETILRVIEEKMEIDLGVMATNTAIADAEVATSLYGLAGEGGSSSVVPQATSGTTPEKADTSMARDILDKIENAWDNVEQKSSDYRKSLSEAERIQVDKEWEQEQIVQVDTALDKVVNGGTGSVLNAAEHYVKGVGDFAEDVADAAAVVGTTIASAGTGLYDGVTYIKSTLAGEDDWHSVTKEMWNSTKTFVSKDVVSTAFDMFDNSSLGQMIDYYSYDNKKLDKMIEGVGYAGGAGKVIGGLSKLTGLSIPASSAVVGATTHYGAGAERAWQDGAGIRDGLNYAAANAVWGAEKNYAASKVIEIFVGGAQGALGKYNMSEGAQKKLTGLYKFGVKTGVTNPLKKTADKEVQPYLQQIYKDDGTSIESSNTLRDFNNITRPSSNINNDNNINVN